MYSSKFLTKEIQRHVGDLMGIKAILEATAVARAIVIEHPLKFQDGIDGEFYEYCALEYVREAVRAFLNRFKLKPTLSPDPQFVLPGFIRIQQYYAIERGGVPLSVPVDQLTEEECDQKYAELIAMGDGCYEHADEFKRYHSGRRSAA